MHDADPAAVSTLRQIGNPPSMKREEERESESERTREEGRESGHRGVATASIDSNRCAPLPVALNIAWSSDYMRVISDARFLSFARFASLALSFAPTSFVGIREKNPARASGCNL